jgi:hypothetical protein
VDASAQHPAAYGARIVGVVDAQRLGSDLAQLFEPFDGGALHTHLTLENLGLLGKIG